jgi:hypothetical protein
MSECPKQVYELSRGLIKVQELVAKNDLEIDTVLHSTGHIGVRVHPFSSDVFQSKKMERLFNDGMVDILDLGRLGCGSGVRVTSNFENMSVTKIDAGPNAH